MKNLIKKSIRLASGPFPEAIALFFARVALAGIFWRSARTKVVEGTWLQMSDTTVLIFENEFGMPAPEITGLITTYAEHFLPILLVFGLFTRIGAAGLLVMTMVIQFFVFPEPSMGWFDLNSKWMVTHISWAAMALILIVRGGGLFSIDKLIGHRFG